MIPLIRRHAAQLAILAVAGLAAPTAVIAQQEAQKAAPAAEAPAPAAAPVAPAAPAPAPVPTVTKESIDNPYGLEALWKGDFVAKITLVILVIMSMGSWYIIITKLYEQGKLMRQAASGQGTSGRRRRCGRARRRSRTAARSASSPNPASRRRSTTTALARERRPQRLDHDVDPARHRQRAKPHAGRPGVPRHRGLDGAVRRPVRHGVGHLPRADRDRHRRPGVDRQGRGSGGRSADHDGHRPRGRGAGGAGLQLARPPQQGRDGDGPRLRRRPARRAAVRSRTKAAAARKRTAGSQPWR